MIQPSEEVHGEGGDAPGGEEGEEGGNEDLPTEAHHGDRLRPGWEEFVDEGSGEVYYYNESTGETSWDKPIAEGAPEEKVSVEDTQGHGQDLLQTSSVEKDCVNVEHDSRIIGTDKDGPESELAPMHPDWEEVVNEANGEVYYYNRMTQETSWDVPRAPSSAPMDYRATAAAKNVPHSTSVADFRPRPPHALASFGFGGRLSVMFSQKASRLSGTSAASAGLRKGPVVIHRLSDLVKSELVALSSMCEARPVPLINLSEEDALKLIEQKAKSALETSENECDGAALLWKLVQIAARFKGRLKSSNGASDPNSPESAIVSLLLGDGGPIPTNTARTEHPMPSPLKLPRRELPLSTKEDKALEEVQTLLVRGKREEAVASALSCRNYTLALIIAAMCDRETYQNVAKQFVDDRLMKGSPLHTTALLFSGQLNPPTDATLDRTGAAPSIWKDSSYNLPKTWKYQLASIINNRTAGWERIMLALGDRLLQLNEVFSAHFCYMVCGCSITDPSHPYSRICLLGCDHIIPMHAGLMTRESIQSYERTEAFEWAKRRGNPQAAIPALQQFKLAYASLLADYGLEDEAKVYIDSVRKLTGIGSRTTDTRLSYPDELGEALDVLEDRVCVSLGIPSSMQSQQSENKGTVSRALEGVSSLLAPIGGKNVPAKDFEPKSAVVEPSHSAGNPFMSGTSVRDTGSVNRGLMGVGMSRIDENVDKQTFSPQQTKLGGDSQIGDEDANSSFVSATSHMTSATFRSAHPRRDGEMQTMSQPILDGVAAPAALPAFSTDESKSSSAMVSPFGHQPAPSMPPVDSTKPPAAVIKNKVMGKAAPSTAPPGPIPRGADTNKGETNAPKSDSAADLISPPPSSKSGWLSNLTGSIAKRLNPDATVADTGEEMQAYYDEKLKRWIFPDTDLDEVIKPLAPPPTALAAASPAPAPAPASNDQLAALMAPPPAAIPGRPRPGMPTLAAGNNTRGGPPPIGGPPPMGMAIPPVTPGFSGPAAAASTPPQFAVFTPQPVTATDEAAETSDDQQASVAAASDPFAAGRPPIGPS